MMKCAHSNKCSLIVLSFSTYIVFKYFSAKRNLVGLAVSNLLTLESEKLVWMADEELYVKGFANLDSDGKAGSVFEKLWFSYSNKDSNEVTLFRSNQSCSGVYHGQKNAHYPNIPYNRFNATILFQVSKVPRERRVVRGGAVGQVT